MGNGGIQIGEPLRNFRGILTGTPAMVGPNENNGSGDDR
jgi:hypothetical protein